MPSPARVVACVVVMWSAFACHQSAPQVVPAAKAMPGDSVIVQGTVMDWTSAAPLSAAGLELSVAGVAGKVVPVVVTDNAGKFVMQPVPLGTYVLHVTYSGYEEQRIRVEATELQPRPLDIRLRPVQRRCPTTRYHVDGCP